MSSRDARSEMRFTPALDLAQTSAMEGRRPHCQHDFSHLVVTGMNQGAA